MPAHVDFPGVERLGFDHRIHLLEEIRIRNVEIREAGSTHRREITIQIKIGSQRGRLIPAHLMVTVLGIAPQRAIHRSLGQGRFDTQDCLGRIGRLLRRSASECKHLRRVLSQMLAHLRHFCVIFDVVIAVRERQSALIHISDDHVCIVQVG